MAAERGSSSSFSDWENLAEKELKGASWQSIAKPAIEGTEPLLVAGPSAEIMDEWPGLFPYTRGIRATMYANRPWTIRQYAGFSTAKESNEFYKNCLKMGQKGLSVAFDLPTHRGYDSDNKLVFGDVGKAGVAIDSVIDMVELFKGIPLNEVSVSMTMNGAVLPILASFIVAAEQSGVKANELSGTIQNDILKEFMVRNTYIYPPAQSMRIVADIMEFVAHNMPRWNSISVSGYHLHEAGADLPLEVALTLANGLTYVKEAMARGLSIDDFAPQISFFFATGMNFFAEVAKLRAARRVWAHLMKGLGAKKEASMMLRTHCQTSGWSLQAQDPYNNIIRTTIEAMASVLGGTQSLHTNSFDEAIALPSAFSAHLARNTQLILQNESLITNVVDPLGGSYFVEDLTNKMEANVRQILHEVDQWGGMIKALEEGIPQSWINEKAAKRQALIDSGQEVIVGVNAYIAPNDSSLQTLKVDNRKVVEEQSRSLQKLRSERNREKVEKALDDLKKAAANRGNLLAFTIDAMRAHATVGEVSAALEEVFGRYHPRPNITLGVYKTVYGASKSLTQLMKCVQDFRIEHGRSPRILVAKLGQDGHDRGAKVIASSFADFGFDVDLSPLFQTPQSIAQQAVDNDVHVVGVSTLAGAHETLIPELISELKKLGGQDIAVVAGGVIPAEDATFLKNAGVLAVFGPGSSAVLAALLIIEKITAKASKA